MMVITRIILAGVPACTLGLRLMVRWYGYVWLYKCLTASGGVHDPGGPGPGTRCWPGRCLAGSRAGSGVWSGVMREEKERRREKRSKEKHAYEGHIVLASLHG